MKVWKVRQYLPALLLHIQRRVEGGRGFLVAIRIRDVCGVDKRCCTIVQRIMKRLEERGLARRHKQGVYLIERRAAREVLAALRQWI
jgi:predicted transcriptional regulator of viral defense system